MNSTSERHVFENVLRILLDPDNGSIPETDSIQSGAVLERLNGDGSNRIFYRFTHPDFSCIAAIPQSIETKHLKEAEAAFQIGQHLYNASIPVPEIFGFDKYTGVVLYEDLGSTHLYDLACSTDFQNPQQAEYLLGTYKKVLDVLVQMQVTGKNGFNENWCWDTPRYDKELMLERESGYFYRQCWLDLLGMEPVQGIEEEFLKLAQKVALSNSDFFLHRDFQSRNVMIKEEEVRIIDFQGGRLGPLGYDVASLLLDPYTSLPFFMQDALFEYYVMQLQKVTEVDADTFYRSYTMLALQRNLQIIGAFCYLGVVCKKVFFRQYIRPSLHNLYHQLIKITDVDLPILKKTIEQALLALPQTL
jgi:N-acetylmuramate 1-kinase